MCSVGQVMELKLAGGWMSLLLRNAMVARFKIYGNLVEL